MLAASGVTLPAENPATGEIIARIPTGDYDFARRAEKDGIEGSHLDREYHERLAALRNDMKQTWRARFRHLPVESWRARATKIGQETDALVSLDRYQALRNDTAYLEDVIGEAAAELDAWIQLQIDIARGK